jgi:hypothetical protein
MKYIKTYEHKNEIWVIPLKMPDFIISLKKIGFTPDKIDHWVKLYNKDVFREYSKYSDRETITIRHEIGTTNGYTWHWYPSTEGDDWNKFMGKLEITPDEIQEYYDKIEMEKAIKKYNI